MGTSVRGSPNPEHFTIQEVESQRRRIHTTDPKANPNNYDNFPIFFSFFVRRFHG